MSENVPEVFRPGGDALLRMQDPTAEYVERVYFPNGRGISIIRRFMDMPPMPQFGIEGGRKGMSYGADSGLFEAVGLTADDELDGDPEGWLTVEDVLAMMQKIAAMPLEIEGTNAVE